MTKRGKKDGATPTEGASPFPSRYEILKLLGRGGGGEVWEARDQATQGLVAIKALHTGYDPVEAEALVRETTTLSGLEGMGFPRVLRLGRASDGRLYLVREMVEGESFEEIQKRRPRQALSLLCSAAKVLTVVHRAGLLHGDIKPANLIVRSEGSVALVDLGLATALREGGQTSVGLTPHFAAPEVRAGGSLTVQAEVFSLGIIARDLLNEGADAELSGIASDALHALVVRATKNDPALRFPSVDEFAQALRAALGGDVGVFDPEGPPWPVRGLDATAYQLKRQIDALAKGGELRVYAKKGAGTSTFLRRASWEEALLGHDAVYVDEDMVRSGLAVSEIESLPVSSALIFVDSLTSSLDTVLDRVRAGGAKVVRLNSEKADGDFEIPPLELSVVRSLFRGALPGMPAQLVERVVDRLGGNPGALRSFALAAQGVPVATEPDIDRILSGAFVEEGSAIEVLERNLDRGHYAHVRRMLEAFEPEVARIAWLRARFELAAGSCEEAKKFSEEAAENNDDPQLAERIKATLSRAHLGLGRYEATLSILEGADAWHPEARVEALAYRGLSLTLLGQNEKALASLNAGFECAQGLGNRRLLALVGSSLATALWRSGDLEGAEGFYQKAMEAARQVGDSGMLASTQINLAGLMKERGDLASSIEFLEGAVDAARRAGRAASLQQALLNLANTDLYLGRLERARSQILQLGEPRSLPAAMAAQLHGLRAELSARSGRVEEALGEFTQCETSWKEMGRLSDASEAALEAVLLAADVPKSAERNTSTYIPAVEVLQERIERGRQYLQGKETALLALAEARTAYFCGESDKAETLATRAFALATESGHREWAWRASSLRALILESAGKRSRAARARREAVEILEDIGAHLPPDLRTVYWSEARRRSLRAMTLGESSEPLLRPGSPDTSTTSLGTAGTDLVSRLSMTPLERRLARVLAINRDLAGEMDLGRLATKIIAHACELLSAERGYLLLGTSAEQLTVCASRGGQGTDHQDFSRSIAAEVLGTGAPLVSVDAGRDQRLQAFESVHLSQVAAVACVPILSPQGNPIGALYLETRTGVRPGFGDEVPTLQAFSDQAAIAIENSRLISELQANSQALEERNQHLKEARARLKEILGKRTARLREVRKELSDAKSQLASHASYGGMVGASDVMRRVYSLIERVKDTDVPVLITGESGTGKEIAARAIYEGSVREKGKMLAVNCGAIPESLLESELFGHVRGAFTGADRDKKGLFREAEGGVLFLDEIGETPLKMQASLLRVLQEKKVRPVGGGAETPVDVRVIFATNRDLSLAVEEGRFREDLLYRIQVIELALPPLHQRQEDIPLLCDHFLSRFSIRFDRPKKSITREAMARLLVYPFPGNIRQLENVLLNAWIMSDEELIDAEDLQLPALSPARGKSEAQRSSASTGEKVLPAEVSARAPARSSSHASAHAAARSSSHASARARSIPLSKQSEKKGTLSEHQRGERRQMVDALEATGWNRLKAAEVMNMPRRTFYRRLRDYNIQ